jgi:uncharacterized membrane protein YfcA
LELHLTLAEYAAILVATCLGAAVQGAIGFGANLISVPVVALFAPEALPTTLSLWVAPLTIAMLVRERSGIDWSGVRWMTVGRVPGTVVGAWVVSAVAVSTLSALCGLAVLAAVGLSLATGNLRVTPLTTTAAGFASGVMGTATSVGGPPVALLYQHRKGEEMRSTLAAGFAVGIVISTTGLVVAGVVHPWQIVLAVALLPALVVGMFLSRPLINWLGARWLRPAVLAVAAVAASLAVVRGLL